MKYNIYSALADIYEDAIVDNEYNNWANYVVNLLNKYISGKSVLDLACGSGFFTRHFKKQGFDVCGVDISQDMIKKAYELSQKENLYIDFFVYDMLKYSGFKKYDAVTVINDGVNYISQDNLSKCFKNFGKNLKKDGIFIFDISTEYKLKNVIGNNMFGEDSDNFSYLWFNNLNEDSVQMSLSVFTKNKDGSYFKKEENQLQYIHKKSDILSHLNSNGFKLLDICSVNENVEDTNCQRYIFVAKKD